MGGLGALLSGGWLVEAMESGMGGRRDGDTEENSSHASFLRPRTSR